MSSFLKIIREYSSYNYANVQGSNQFILFKLCTCAKVVWTVLSLEDVHSGSNTSAYCPLSYLFFANINKQNWGEIQKYKIQKNTNKTLPNDKKYKEIRERCKINKKADFVRKSIQQLIIQSKLETVSTEFGQYSTLFHYNSEPHLY